MTACRGSGAVLEVGKRGFVGISTKLLELVMLPIRSDSREKVKRSSR